MHQLLHDLVADVFLDLAEMVQLEEAAGGDTVTRQTCSQNVSSASHDRPQVMKLKYVCDAEAP